MKTKWKAAIAAGVIVFAAACVFGGQAVVERIRADQVEEAERQRAARETREAAETADGGERETEVSLYIPAPAARPEGTDAAQEPSCAPAGETITVEEDGTVVIEPNFSAQRNGATKVVTPDAQVEANMGGSGGGELPLDEDGAYHGDAPDTPAATAEPAGSAPAPTDASTPSSSTESGGESSGGGAPNYKGAYDGERTPDGKYEWWALGNDGVWVEVGGTVGGGGGQIDDSDRYAPGTGLTGEKVGDM